MKKIIIKGTMSFLLIIILFATSMTAYATEVTTSTGIPISEIGSRIDELITTYIDEFTPGLAIAVVHDGEIVFMQGYGYADVERGMLVDPSSTIFSHASINKLFVWVSAMQLVEQGLLDLDNNISEYLPDDLMVQFNFRYNFTMRDLMNHSAGFAEIPFYADQNAEDVQVRKILREALIMFQPNQIFQPGTAKGYSNYGTALAAYIVSYISGMNFEYYVQANIFEPLGMASTKSQPHWFGDNEFAQNRARGYRSDGSGGFIQDIWLYTFLHPQGGSAGTAIDLARFAIALTPPQGETSPLFNNRSTLDLMLSPSYDVQRSPAFRGMTHGWARYSALYPTFGHAGSLPDVTTDFVIVPSHRFAIVVQANSPGGAGGTATLIDKIFDLTIGYSVDPTLPIVDGLPNAESVTGSFLYLRRFEGNVREAGNALYRYWRIDAIDENTITLTWTPLAAAMGMAPDIVITYRQIEPYLFRAIHATPDASSIVRGMHEIYFIMENGRPVQISTSWGFDAKIQTFGQSGIAVLGGIAINIASTIFFTIMSIVVLFDFLRRKKEGINRFTYLSNGLLFCGLMLGINYWAFEARYMLEPRRSFMQLNFATPHIWINWILLVVIAVLLVASAVFWKKDIVTIKRRVLYSATVVTFGTVLFVLSQWNFL